MLPGYSDAILIDNLLKTFCQIEELKQTKNHHLRSHQILFQVERLHGLAFHVGEETDYQTFLLPNRIESDTKFMSRRIN